MTRHLSNTTGILQRKKKHVHPPPKKNPGSAPVPQCVDLNNMDVVENTVTAVG